MDETNNKNGFIKGLATGVACALLIGLIGFFIYASGLDFPKKDAQMKPTAVPSQGAEATGTPKPGNNLFSSVTDEELLAKLREIRNWLDNNSLYGATDETMVDSVYAGLMYSLGDAYAAYYNKEDMDAMMEETEGTYCGIGTLVTQNVYTGVISIVRPFKDGPAYKAGMKKDDIILLVDNIDVSTMELSEVVKLMKGEPKTPVDITVQRGEEQLVLHVIRDYVEVETVEYEMLENNVGYVRVTEFDDVTVEQFKKAIAELEKQNMTSLVIDLRDNPGGLVNSAVKMVDRIISTGVVVYTEDKDKSKSCEYATTAQHLDVPIALLVNENSASASEIFSGALRDYEKAILVGTNTYGKGIVQVITYLNDGSGIKFTISEYFTPKGIAVHGIGLKPDFEVELPEEVRNLSDIPRDKDTQLQKAVEELKKKTEKK